MISFDLGKIIVSDAAAKKCLKDKEFFKKVKRCLVKHSKKILDKFECGAELLPYNIDFGKYPLISYFPLSDCKVFIETEWKYNITKIDFEVYKYKSSEYEEVKGPGFFDRLDWSEDEESIL